MAIYHCSIKIINRASGRSAVAASAYRSGTKMKNEESGKVHNFRNKKGVIYSEVDLPQNAPGEFENREVLWNSVQQIEKNANAQLAREVEVALPNEWDHELQKEVVRSYVKEQFVKHGMCADWALHDKEDGNPHAHILLTTRPITSNGNWGKKTIETFKLDENGNRIPKIDPRTGKQKLKIRKGHGSEKIWKKEKVSVDWNNRENAEKWRSAWAEICNKHLSMDNQIDHRSYKRQGIEQLPTIHLGHTALEMEKRGRTSDRVSINKEIAQSNFEILELNEQERNLAAEIENQARVLNNKKDNLIVDEFNKRHQNTMSILKEEKPISIEEIMGIYQENGLELKKDTMWRINFNGKKWSYRDTNMVENIVSKNLQRKMDIEKQKEEAEKERKKKEQQAAEEETAKREAEKKEKERKEAELQKSRAAIDAQNAKETEEEISKAKEKLQKEFNALVSDNTIETKEQLAAVMRQKNIGIQIDNNGTLTVMRKDNTDIAYKANIDIYELMKRVKNNHEQAIQKQADQQKKISRTSENKRSGCLKRGGRSR